MKALALVGPTGVGKTELSIGLARTLDGEIISMDSRQVYRGMDIGTDKAGAEARERVPHHGLDLIGPDQRYSAVRFARDARRWMGEIRTRGRVPILVGGTGFFLKALVDPVFREPPVDEGRRSRLRVWLEGRPSAELERWVRALDPDRGQVAAVGGRQRMSRTLEVALLTGRPLSWWHRNAPPEAAAVELDVVLLERPRDELYARIDARTRSMFEGGVLDEVRALQEGGIPDDAPGMTGTGYREARAVVRGELDLAEAIERVQSATRGYARRQLTWFRNQLDEPLLRLSARSPIATQIAEIEQWRKRTGAASQG